jgi:hypothetical protein
MIDAASAATPQPQGDTMPDNLIRAILVLASPLLIVYAIVLGSCHALVSAFEEFMAAWRDPQSTHLGDFNLWK